MNRHAKAIAIQDASNIRAVARTLSEFLSENPDPREPANVLLFSKLASMLPFNLDCLGGVQDHERDYFVSAYDECKRLSE